MKGIILAGGTGSRLGKLTSVLNKHLVAVGKYPMIEYPLATLKNLGIDKEIIIVTGAEHVGTMVQYFTKEHPEINFTYKVQQKAGGIAQALSLVESVCNGDKIAVILGDNIFSGDFSQEAKEFCSSDRGAMFFFKKVPDPQRFGVPKFDAQNKLLGIYEKPALPPSDLAVTGLYFFDSTVFDKIRELKPSARGEYEISETNHKYIQERRAVFKIIDGFWSDAGTHLSRKLTEQFINSSGFIPCGIKKDD